LRWKWLAVFLLLPLVVPPAPRGQGDLMVLDVLDVGQGTAALLQAGARRLLYDSGPGDGAGRNLVRPVIGPALGAVAPDRVVISHADLDHAGGLGGLSNRYPGAGLWVNAPDRTAAPCRSGWRWDWAETRIAALHPSPGLPYLGNDSSCVLSVRGPGGGILLAGDVSEAIERRLLAEGLGPHEVLLVPHHGSTSSSSAGFLERVAPRVAIATAALGNRFCFPAGTIRERYRAAGIPLLTTGECGGLRVRLEGGEILSVTSARRDRQRIWRWPAAGHCP
jgi:competence protein ComEC